MSGQEKKQEDPNTEQNKEESGKADPRKGDSNKDWKQKVYNLIYDLIIIGGIIALAGGGYRVYSKYKGDADAVEMYDELAESFVSVEDTPSTEEKTWDIQWSSGNSKGGATATNWYKQLNIDFKGLNKVNEDVVGWVYIEDTKVNYPIMYSGDNYYIDHTLYKEYSASGSIFMEGINQPDFSDPVTILYGHNMKNQAMFGSLRNYKEDGYYEKHPYFQIFAEDGMVYRYQIFAFFDIDQYEHKMVEVKFYEEGKPETYEMKETEYTYETEVWHPSMQFTYPITTEGTTEVVSNKENTYENYLKILQERSLLKKDIPVTTQDKIVCLFTCSANKGNRFIIYGKQIAEHDTTQVEETAEDIESLDR